MKRFIAIFAALLLAAAVIAGAAALRRRQSVSSAADVTVADETVADPAQQEKTPDSQPDKTVQQTQTEKSQTAAKPAAQAAASVTQTAPDAQKPEKAVTAPPAVSPTEATADDSEWKHGVQVYYTVDGSRFPAGTGYTEYAESIFYPIMDMMRVSFSAEGKDWMVMLCKGQHGWIHLGGEIAVLTAPAGTYTGKTADLKQYAAPEAEDQPVMSMALMTSADGGKTYRTDSQPYARNWMMLGAREGQVTRAKSPLEEVKLALRVTFVSPETAAAFAAALEKAGFAKAADKEHLSEDAFYLQGSDVWMNWKTILYDSFE